MPRDLWGEIQRTTGEHIAGVAGTVAGVHLGEFVHDADRLRQLADELDRVARETPQAAVDVAQDRKRGSSRRKSSRRKGGRS